MDFIICLVIIYRYNYTTGTFTVPSGGDRYHYSSALLTVNVGEFGYFHVLANGDLICTVLSDVTLTHEFDSELICCDGVTYAVEGIHKY